MKIDDLITTQPLTITFGDTKIRADIEKGATLTEALEEILKARKEIEASDYEEVDNIDTAPLMEAKLREMVRMLPNIITGLEILSSNPDVMQCERDGAAKTLDKLKAWRG